ncbi:Glutathione S-transferase F10 [Dissostichus eleginoides]|uniref:Glutathione S-transferase F10 n=1 Tax=Dissostichus eleginoides TaxID=100907 RepID=A0AAD9C374_DISEL|nr:Glutathione S-transferase F10 [Dissostichus eleginoides]
MLDSCNVMRGSKSGLETRIRDKHCQTLLDIDGDSCHHIHNAAKKFAAPFCHNLEQLFTDLHTDHLWASDQVHYLMEVCELMGIPGTNPQRFTAHPWLSAYDVVISTRRMLPAYKNLYMDILEEIYKDHGVGERAKARIQFFHQDLRKKGMTQVGKDRKERLVKKVWFESLNTNLHLSVYLGVLPILKEYVMVFQGSQTLVHKLHDKQLEVVTSFMACFVKAEHLHTTPKKLVEMEFSDKMLPLRELYVGPLAEKLKAEHPNIQLIVLQFLNTVKTAYISTAAYMQKKLPLNSRTLQALSALDPLVRGNSETGILLKRLSGPEMMGHLVPPQCDVPLEVVKFNVDRTLPLYLDGDSMVTWWANIMATGKYPGLNHVVKGGLSIFHGPMVESSFSAMGDIISQKRTSMSMATCNAIQTTKDALKSRCQTAIQMFKTENVKLSTVDKALCKNIRTAGTKDKTRRKQALLKKKERQEEFGCQPTTSAEQSRKIAVEKDRHVRQIAAQKRKKALELLVQAKKAKK